MKLRKMATRLSALLLTLCCAVMLGSCKVTETATTTTSIPGKNTIQPAVLTQEESDLLELLDVQQPMLFDFSVEGAFSYRVEIFTLQDGAWQPSGGSTSPIDEPDLRGRIALTFGEDGQFAGVAFQDEDGVSRISQDPETSAFLSHASTSVADPIEIVLDEPIALWAYYGEQEAAASTTAYFPDHALQNPQEIQSDFVQLITITFSAAG